jgi:Golgi nucleoside diphosphatase
MKLRKSPARLADDLLRRPSAQGITLCRTLQMEAAGSFETMVTIYQVTRCHPINCGNPETFITMFAKA